MTDVMVGRTGRVTGAIGPDQLERSWWRSAVAPRAFHAYAADSDESIPKGARVVLIEYLPPRTVVVTRV
jgi:hypothetical protein